MSLPYGRKIAAACLCVFVSFGTLVLAHEPRSAVTHPATAMAGKEWIAKAADNLCGLRDSNQVSNPAVVDFDTLMAATTEMRTLRDQKIEPSSPEGIRLTNAAMDRVTNACEVVRIREGHCSVWKSIRHRDGRAVADITEKVKAQF